MLSQDAVLNLHFRNTPRRFPGAGCRARRVLQFHTTLPTLPFSPLVTGAPQGLSEFLESCMICLSSAILKVWGFFWFFFFLMAGFVFSFSFVIAHF